MDASPGGDGTRLYRSASDFSLERLLGSRHAASGLVPQVGTPSFGSTHCVSASHAAMTKITQSSCILA